MFTQVYDEKMNFLKFTKIKRKTSHIGGIDWSKIMLLLECYHNCKVTFLPLALQRFKF